MDERSGKFGFITFLYNSEISILAPIGIVLQHINIWKSCVFVFHNLFAFFEAYSLILQFLQCQCGFETISISQGVVVGLRVEGI